MARQQFTQAHRIPQLQTMLINHTSISVTSPECQKDTVNHSLVETHTVPGPLVALAPNAALALREFAFSLGSLHTFKKTSEYTTSLWWANTRKLKFHMESQSADGP